MPSPQLEVPFGKAMKPLGSGASTGRSGYLGEGPWGCIAQSCLLSFLFFLTVDTMWTVACCWSHTCNHSWTVSQRKASWVSYISSCQAFYHSNRLYKGYCPVIMVNVTYFVLFSNLYFVEWISKTGRQNLVWLVVQALKIFNRFSVVHFLNL